MSSTSPPPALLDKSRVQAFFNKAAHDYDQVAVLHREVGQRVMERLHYVRISPELIIDIGCATGVATADLANQYRKARVIGLDLAFNMLPLAHQRNASKGGTGALSFLSSRNRMAYICGDAEHLPLQDNSCDLLFSNLTLQWCNDLELVFGEFMRILRPGGLLMFSTLGPDTLIELRQSWAAADTDSHVSTFIDMHDIGDALLRARFADPVMDSEYLTLTYPSVNGLMQDLKTAGSRNATDARTRGLTGRRRFKTMIAHYETLRQDELIPATYEVVYGHAWKSEKKVSQENQSTVATFPLSRLKRR